MSANNYALLDYEPSDDGAWVVSIHNMDTGGSDSDPARFTSFREAYRWAESRGTEYGVEIEWMAFNHISERVDAP